MVEDTVENDAHILFMRLLEQFVERRLPAQQGVDAEKIKGMVTVVGRGENRIQIEGGDAQIFEIIQLFCDAVQVAALKPCTVGGVSHGSNSRFPAGLRVLFKTIRKNLIKNRVLYPVWRCH